MIPDNDLFVLLAIAHVLCIHGLLVPSSLSPLLLFLRNFNSTFRSCFKLKALRKTVNGAKNLILLDFARFDLCLSRPFAIILSLIGQFTSALQVTEWEC